MEFCNLIGKHLPKHLERKIGSTSGIPLVIEADEALSEYGGVSSNVWVQSTGDKVVIRSAGEGSNAVVENNLFAISNPRDQHVFPPIKRRGEWLHTNPTLWADVQDTEENPAIIVMCRAIHLVNGVKSYIKLLNISKDYMLVMLVSGAIGFEDDDLQALFMARNLEEGVSVERRATKWISATKLNEMLLLQDSSGYRYNMDMVVSACVSFESDLVNVKVMKDSCVIIDPQAKVRAKSLADSMAEKARKEEERKAKEAEEMERIRKERKEELARQRKEEQQKAEAKREESRQRARDKAAATRAAKKAEQSAKSEIKTPEGTARNTGAEMFLSMLGSK